MKKITGCLTLLLLTIVSFVLLLFIVITVFIKAMEVMATQNVSVSSTTKISTHVDEELKTEKQKINSFSVQKLADVPFGVTMKTANGANVNTIAWNGIYYTVNAKPLTKLHGGDGRFADITDLQISGATVLLLPSKEYYTGGFPFIVFSEDGWVFLSCDGIVANSSELGYSIQASPDEKTISVYTSGEESVD